MSPEETLTLAGSHIRLEPLGLEHVEGLVTASAAHPSLYQWSLVPQGGAAMKQYVETALSWKRAGTAMPFATIEFATGRIIGSTRFWNIERWSWPPNHPRFGRKAPDACEIGYTWLTASAIRTAVNTEAKLLMLRYAFESWGVLRVCFHTDARNLRSRAALERLGASREGLLRAHRLAADYSPRDSVRYSIIEPEWPGVKRRLESFLRGSKETADAGGQAIGRSPRAD
jgi:RimJ/RimL family protein N-acetyltransferase